MVRKLANYIFMKTSIVTNKLNTHYFITSTKLKLLTLLMVLFSSWGWGQNASQYTYTQSSGTYTPLTSPTVLGSGSLLDDETYSISAGSLSGFAFNFAGSNYTAFTISANGFIGLGSNIMAGGLYTPLSSTGGGNVFVSAYSDDLGGLSSATQISWKLLGSAPNRELVIEYKNIRNYNRTGADLSFQIRLIETSNIINIVYGTMTYTSTTSDAVQVGIKSSTTSGHFSNRTTTTNWNSTTAGSSNSSSCSVLNTVTMPSSGLTFTFAPPTPCTGSPSPGNTIASVNPILNGSSTVLSLQNTTSGTGVTYQWKSSADNITFTNISGATSATYSASPTVSTYYVCDVTCSGVTTTSNSVQVNMVTCYTPNSLTSSTISYQTATIGWTAPATGTSPANYEYEVRTSGAAGSGATGLVASGTTTAPTVSASLTGLNGGTAYSYYVRSNCGGGDYSSWSSAGSFTTLSCSGPTGVTSSALTYTSATIGWTAPATGSPAGYEYEVRTSGTAGSGSTGLIASGTTTGSTVSASITGLTAGTTYSIYVRSNCYSGFNSSWTSAVTFSTVKIEPSNQITALAAGTVTSTDIPLTWTAAIAGTQAPDGYLIKASSVDLNSVTDPVDGTDPTNVTVFTSNAANKKQTTGTATSTTTFTGTAPGTMYYYKVYSYTNTGTAIDFNTNSPATLSHATKPNAVSSTLTAESITSSSIGFSWSSTAYLSGANDYMIFAKAGSAVTVGSPVLNPTTYSASSTFGSGTVYEADASAFCVYKGDGTSVNLSGLSAATTYHFLIYAVVSNANSNGSFSFATGTSVNRTTLCDATTSFPTSEAFATYLPTTCWQEGDLGNITAGPTTIGGASISDWIEDGFLNSGTTGAAKMNIDAASGSEWLLSPFYTIPATGYRVKFSVGATNWNGTSAVTNWESDDFVELLVSTSNANWTVLRTYNATNVPSNLGQVDNVDISAYNSQTVRFAFRAFEGTSNGSADIDFFIDNFVIETIPTYTWTGATSTAWNTTTNWSPAAVPTSTDNVIIPSTGITNFPVATSLTIASGSTMTLNSNAQLTINGTLTNNGTLTLESGATLVQGTGNTVAGSGTFNVKQALTGAGGSTPSGRFWYLGSPVSGATSTVFNAAGDNRLWTFAEATQSYTEITTNGVSMSPMQGHVARLGANETSIFTGGLLNTGNYTNSSLTNTGTGSTRGYTLLSNPYPSYLDWTAAYTAAVATNVNLSSSIWYRSNDGTNMVYDIYNATGAIATNNSGGTTTQYIPPMQAFWVYNPNDGTTGSVTFSNSMRSHQNNGGLKSSTDFPAFVRLNLENDGAIDQTVLYFDNNAATGYDNFDSDKMMVSNAAQVYSFVDNKKLAINGMKSIKANKQVPLTVEFPTAKSYSFNATEVAMTDGIVLLEDRLMNVFQDLTMNPVYAFDAVAGTDANRFVVHFQANSGVAGIETAEENGIDIVSNASGLVTITLSEELPAMGTIQIIDINGKVIATQAINEQTTTMNINAATGVYHVLVDSALKVARKKIVITK